MEYIFKSSLFLFFIFISFTYVDASSRICVPNIFSNEGISKRMEYIKPLIITPSELIPANGFYLKVGSNNDFPSCIHNKKDIHINIFWLILVLSVSLFLILRKLKSKNIKE
jgi:hypothetical protein